MLQRDRLEGGVVQRERLDGGVLKRDMLERGVLQRETGWGEECYSKRQSRMRSVLKIYSLKGLVLQ